MCEWVPWLQASLMEGVGPAGRRPSDQGQRGVVFGESVSELMELTHVYLEGKRQKAECQQCLWLLLAVLAR